MTRRTRLWLAIVPVLVVAAGACAVELTEPRAQAPSPESTAQPSPPPGSEPLPDGAIVFDSDRTGTFEIFVLEGPEGEHRQLTDDEQTDAWWGRLSPDRRTILFYRTPAGVHDRDFTKTALWSMNADGSEQTELRPAGLDGWVLQGHAEWSPDGEALVMFGGPRGRSPQLYITGPDGRDAQQLTDRGGQNLDPVWSPDGQTIWFVACPSSVCFPDDYEIYRMPAEGGEPERITSDNLRDHDPYVSPDGRRVAWLTQTSTEGPVGQWNIRIQDTDGGPVTMVTDDEAVNSRPEWTRDGSRILFHRLEPASGRGFQLYSIRPDGTDMTPLTEDAPGINEYPST